MSRIYFALVTLVATTAASPIIDHTPEDAPLTDITKRSGKNNLLDFFPVLNYTAQHYGGAHSGDGNFVASDIRISVGRITPGGKIPLCDQAINEDDPFSLPKHDAFWDIPLWSVPFNYYYIWPVAGNGATGKGTLDVSGPGPNGEPCGTYRMTVKMPRQGCYTVQGYIEGFGSGPSMNCLHYWQDGDQ